MLKRQEFLVSSSGLAQTACIRRAVMASAAALFCLSLSAATPPSREHGFAPEKLYQFSNVDSVNLFNGNVIITVPIGIEYPAHAFSYRFQLVYNSKAWTRQYDYSDEHPCSDLSCVVSRPHRQSNAGVGWRLSFGRLFGP